MSSGSQVLDASAVLAFLFDEPGAEAVSQTVPRAVVATVNWSEVCQRLVEHGAEIGEARTRLLDTGLAFEPVSVSDAEDAARMRSLTREAGLSLGDRCCLAVARRLGCPALTADAAWTSVDLGVDVRLIR